MGSLAVETEDKFIKVGLQVVRTERALVRAKQPSLHERRHSVSSWENVMRFQTGVPDNGASMYEIIANRLLVGCQTIGKDCRTKFNMGQEKRSQTFGIGAGNDLNAAAAESHGVGLLLYGHRNEDFSLGSSPALSRVNAADHRFIHFNSAGKPCVLGGSNRTAESMQHRPGGLVRTKPQKAMERFS